MKHDIREQGAVTGSCRACGKRGVSRDGYCAGNFSHVLNCSSELGILHAIMFEESTPQGWLPREVYMHGEDVGDVALKFWRVRQSDRRAIHMVGIAPAIGLFVEDNQGMVLSAT